MNVLGVILARAGSKGFPGKCLRPLLDRPVIAYTFDHVAASKRLTGAILSTDSPEALALAQQAGIEVVDRPAELATDTATVDAAARHAVEHWEQAHGRGVDIVVLLYGNIPVRAEDLIDRAVEHLIETGADSVRSVAPVTKQHPDWVHRLDGDRMSQFRQNSIYRRQDLTPLYYHDGAVAAVTRGALFAALDKPDDHQAFLGEDRRAIIQRPEDAVDIDAPVDLFLAEAILRSRADRSAVSVSPAENSENTVTIGKHRVGPGEPVFVVAEAGVNHNGCVDTALRLVDAAADAGADAVKFQLFRASDLVTASALTTESQRAGCGEKSQREMLARLELSVEDFVRIKAYCDERSITFLITPFGCGDVGVVVELGAPAIKIASTDLTNSPLLQDMVSTGLPLILSTGASTQGEIRRTVESIRRHGAGRRLILLHCVSCYPTPVAAANLRAVETLRRSFGVPCGVSDHTTATEIGAWAVAAGCCILEKHFTLDRSMSGPDHAMSLAPDQLREYVCTIRAAEQALGAGVIGLTEREAEVRALASRSIVSAVDIHAGVCLTSEMLTLKRPGTGLSADSFETLLGRHARVNIPADTIMSWDMVQ